VRKAMKAGQKPPKNLKKASFEILEEKVEKFHEMLIRKALTTKHYSKKRSVFLEWQAISVRQKGAILAIENVIKKGMFLKGFIYIKHRAFKAA
jgi:hypothetical protein